MSEAPRARLGLTGRTIAGSALVVLLVGAALAVLIVAIESLRTDSSRANHSQTVVSTANRLERVVLDIETGSRGYVITHRESFLAPWQSGLNSFPMLTSRLARLVAQEPAEQAAARQIASQETSYIQDYSKPLIARARVDPTAARSIVTTGEGKRRIDKIRRLFTRLIGAEESLASARERHVRTQGQRAVWLGVAGLALSLLAIGILAWLLGRTVALPIRRLAETTRRLGAGDLSARVPEGGAAEVGELMGSFNSMAATLDEHDWLTSSRAKLSEAIQGKERLGEAAAAIVATLAPLVHAERVVYLHLDGGELRPLAVHGGEPDASARRFAIGEGLPGQAAADGLPRWLAPPAGYAPIESALGAAAPLELGLVPVTLGDESLAVLEVASFEPFGTRRRQLVESFAASAGAAIATIVANTRTRELLVESQQQAATLSEQAVKLQAQSEELQSQSEELHATNEELTQQAQELQTSEEELQAQQEELQKAYRDLQATAASLADSSRYKSEFLANVSHELRTPLNSLLILARLLAENADGNLSAKQIQFAETVHEAGVDLLDLINDILDLSKIEAGRIDVSFGAIDLGELSGWAERFGRPLAEEKGLDFTIALDPGTPTPVSDEQRLQQILSNLLGNAFKFTERGQVSLTVGPAADGRVAFTVTDTGIGVAEPDQATIFEAFTQVEGGTSRRFGGTGLGLSISRQLADLLGAELILESALGKGSIFRLLLPVRTSQSSTAAASIPVPRPAQPVPASTKRVLVVEDDPHTIAALEALLTGDGLEVLAATGIDQAVATFDTASVDCLLLDLGLEGGGGLELLRQLKLRGLVPGLPVVVHTGRSLDHEQEVALLRLVDTIVVKDAASPDRLRDEVAALLTSGSRHKAGPAGEVDGFLDGRTVLVVDDDVRNIFALTSLFERHGADVRYAENGRDALARLDADPAVDIILMDVMMPELDGHEATRVIRADPRFRSVPVIALTANAMPGDRELAIAAGASDYISKPVDNERLLSLLRVWLYER